MKYRLTRRGTYVVALVHMLTVFLLAGFAGAIENGTGPTLLQVSLVLLFVAGSYAAQRIYDGSES